MVTGKKVYRCRIATPTVETIWVMAWNLTGVDKALEHLYADIPFCIEWVQCESQHNTVLIGRDE